MVSDDRWVGVRTATSFCHGLHSPTAATAAARNAGFDGVALLDRDGTWASVAHLAACTEFSARAALGVSLVTLPVSPNAARPGVGAAPRAEADYVARLATAAARGRRIFARAPRVTVFAAATCLRQFFALTSRAFAHDAGGPGRPVALHTDLAAAAAGGLAVCLGPDSEVHALARSGSAHAVRATLRAYKDLVGHVHVLIGSDTVSDRAVADAARAENVPVVFLPVARAFTPREMEVARLLDAIDIGQPLHALAPTDERAMPSAPASAAMLRRLGQYLDHDDGYRLAGVTATFMHSVTLEAADLGVGRVHPAEDEMVVATSGGSGRADIELRDRCHGAVNSWYPDATAGQVDAVRDRLDDELRVVGRLGFAPFFLTTATVADLARERVIRAFARGSGVGSMIAHLLGLTPLCPIRHELLMERFCSTLHTDLPDIDIDVESHRRHEVYRACFEHFGNERVAAVGMIDTFRARSAIREVGHVLGLTPGRIDRVAKAAPWFDSDDVAESFQRLPELAASNVVDESDRPWLDLCSRLRGIPRHASMHPCGLVISAPGLMDRVTLQATGLQWPMCQLDKNDVETAGLLKVDILGVRMQSAIAHATASIERVEGAAVDTRHVPTNDAHTYAMLRSTETVGIFQVESPGQRALAGKMCPADLDDITAAISLFRPGPVMGDMIGPYVAARHGTGDLPAWPQLVWPVVEHTGGVVIWHEQVIRILALTAGIDRAAADIARRRLATTSGREEVATWWFPAARAQGLANEQAQMIWDVVSAFAAFGFCKAHAAAFGHTTYESAWLKANHPAHLFAGLLEHEPGLYPRRVLLAEARRIGIAIDPPCVQRAALRWQVSKASDAAVAHEVLPTPAMRSGVPLDAARPVARGYTLHAPLSLIEGMSIDERERLAREAPFTDVADLWHRGAPTTATLELLATCGALRAVPGVPAEPRAALATAVHTARAGGGRARSGASQPLFTPPTQTPELACDLSLPAMSLAERVTTERDVCGLDLSAHALADSWDDLVEAGVTPARELHRVQCGAETFIAGIRSVVHTPPTRSGIRVVFISLDDPTGLTDAAFFPSHQGAHSRTAMTNDAVVIRGKLTREMPRSHSITALEAWTVDEFLRAQLGDLPPR